VIVIDASVMIEVLLRGPASARIEDRILGPAQTLHAPHLLDLEVAQVLRRYVLRGELDPERGVRSIDLLQQFPIQRYSHEPLLTRIWALRENLTAYDAAYVALAEALRAPLLTRDAKLASARGHRADMELL
jgi:predicted nucleic acid-binding protein